MIEWVSLLVKPISDIISKFVPDRDKANQMAHEIAMTIEQQAHKEVMAQIDVNNTQATHASIFVAGARPAIMWICGVGLAWNFIIQPMIMWITFFIPECGTIVVDGEVTGFDYSNGFCSPDLSSAPELEIGELTTLLFGLLGLGGMRTYEKRHGVARSTLQEK
jgi:hypothetical protein